MRYARSPLLTGLLARNCGHRLKMGECHDQCDNEGGMLKLKLQEKTQLLLFLSSLAVCSSLADTPREHSRTIKPAFVSTAPKIDGRLDEALWEAIEPLTEFWQREPHDGDQISERTEVRVCYDSANLYFAVRAWDNEPERLVRSVFERDGFMPADDSMLFAIDSNDDDRTAFVFEGNTAGAQTDIEVGEGGDFNIDWDPIWDYKVTVDDEGYSMEVVIPFFVLRFKESESVNMGLLIKRRIKRNREESNWPYVSRDYELEAVSQYGNMIGLKKIERGKNLEFKPYGKLGYSETTTDSRHEADVGLDVKWGITPNLTADLTLNTDFAEVESDELKINLTRFNLFFPEKRDFFLESANLFRFGLRERVEVFFSRRIGLRQSEAVPIIGGARTYGLFGDTNLGLMTIQTTESGDYEGENFTVARLKQNFARRSYAGGIITSRRGNQLEQDTTVGGDFLHILDNNISFHGSLAQSRRPDSEGGNWFGMIGAVQFTDKYAWEVRYDDVGESFDPGIGFVVRPDQRTLTGYGQYSPRPGWKGVRQINIAAAGRRIENHEDILETRTLLPSVEITFQSEDRVQVRYTDTYDFVPESFRLGPLIVPTGRYQNRTGGFEIETSPSRRIASRAGFESGSFYNGTLDSANASVQLRPFTRLHLNGEGRFDHVELPGGKFESLISRFYVSYFLNARLSTRAAVQHSSLYDEFILNIRLRWIYAPGSELWFVYNEGRDLAHRLEPSLQDRALIVKLVHNFNF